MGDGRNEEWESGNDDGDGDGGDESQSSCCG